MKHIFQKQKETTTYLRILSRCSFANGQNEEKQDTVLHVEIRNTAISSTKV